jgi:GNAT superfamily N-acetyltransferase
MALGFVRPARPGDAEEIARIQLSTWRTAYRRMFPPHVLANLDEAYLARGWREAISEPPSTRHRVLIAVEQGDSSSWTVGFAASGPADEQALAPEEPELGDDVAAITDLLVEPRWGRRGHGSRLLAAVSDIARSGGAARLQVWLLEGDRASSGFYESAGWGPDGWARTLDTGSGPLREIRWHALLDDPEATS